ncbi:carboxylesterase family protein [Phlyctema vagabunda]|uniref:Carboxylic ester hydrolase n=1 Tax=Phlyctema vagabunda TaxID=108571 RepID=A0ABR4PQZ5_9HELO
MKSINLPTACRIAILGLASIASCTSGPVVDLGYARYQGSYDLASDINTFYGIRYAQAPTGTLRWQAPQSIEAKNNYSKTAVINATTVGVACHQTLPGWFSTAGFPSGTLPGSEDCLLLDVLAPANPNSSNLPVMVQIHGGGYTTGSAETVSPGNSLVYQSGGSLIYVSIQYRLGAHGFLGGPKFLENGVGNVGLLDQRAALEWVKRNIENFGGDPNQVTIIGGSAGGGSVTQQLTLYGGVSDPPFRAAIADYPWWQPFHDDGVLQSQYDLLLNFTSCGDLECLRGVPEAELANATGTVSQVAYEAGFYGYGDFYFGPYVDGTVVLDLPSEQFKKGNFAKVPLLTDREGYEGTLFSNPNEVTIEQATAGLEILFPNAEGSFFTRLFQLYPSSDFNSTFFQRQQIFGDFIINCPTYYMASAVSDLGIPAYKMIFNAGRQTHGSLGDFITSVELNGTGNNVTLGSIIRSYYISFAVALDPNTNSYTNISHPYWPSYQENEGNFSVLDVTYTTVGAAPDREASAQCDFFHSQSYAIRN